MSDYNTRWPWIGKWFADVLGPAADDETAQEAALRHVDDVCRGTVKFFKDDKGWGAIASDDTPKDVWVHYSNIEGRGHRVPVAGARVEFRWEPTFQDSFRCNATWMRTIAGPRG